MPDLASAIVASRKLAPAPSQWWIVANSIVSSGDLRKMEAVVRLHYAPLLADISAAIDCGEIRQWS